MLWHCWLGGRKGIRPVKIWGDGDGGGGHWLVLMEWRPAGWSVCLPLLISLCTIKSRSSLLAPDHPGGPGERVVKRLWCGGGSGYHWRFCCGISGWRKPWVNWLTHVRPENGRLKCRWWCKLVIKVLINVFSVVNGSTHKECPCGIWSCIGAVVQCLTDKPVYHRKHHIYLILVCIVICYC